MIIGDLVASIVLNSATSLLMNIYLSCDEMITLYGLLNKALEGIKEGRKNEYI